MRMNLLKKLFGQKKKLKNGTWREYNKHAVMITEGQFLNDLKHGAWRYYYDTGGLAIEEHYELGKKHGTYKSFFPGGMVMSEGRYEHDLREGYFHVYDERERLVRVILYAHNVLVTDTKYPVSIPSFNVLISSEV